MRKGDIVRDTYARGRRYFAIVDVEHRAWADGETDDLVWGFRWSSGVMWGRERFIGRITNGRINGMELFMAAEERDAHEAELVAARDRERGREVQRVEAT